MKDYQEKAVDLETVCVEFLPATTLSIREVASVIGRIVASFPWVMHGPLYHKHCKMQMNSLTAGKGQF